MGGCTSSCIDISDFGWRQSGTDEKLGENTLFKSQTQPVLLFVPGLYISQVSDGTKVTKLSTPLFLPLSEHYLRYSHIPHPSLTSIMTFTISRIKRSVKRFARTVRRKILRKRPTKILVTSFPPSQPIRLSGRLTPPLSPYPAAARPREAWGVPLQFLDYDSQATRQLTPKEEQRCPDRSPVLSSSPKSQTRLAGAPTVKFRVLLPSEILAQKPDRSLYDRSLYVDRKEGELNTTIGHDAGDDDDEYDDEYDEDEDEDEYDEDEDEDEYDEDDTISTINFSYLTLRRAF